MNVDLRFDISMYRSLRRSGLGIGLGCASYFISYTAPTNNAVSKSASCDSRGFSNFIADAVEKASPSVVNIQSTSGSRFITGIYTGSGFIISKDGFIVTNAHVVSKVPKGNKVYIRMWDGGAEKQGTVHSLDEVSDIALIKLDMNDDDDLPVATLGSSSSLRAGEFVVALGSPLMLQGTVTCGIVSSTARHSSELGMGKNLTEYIQTDAAINQGNSGGPLVNVDGEVVGIAVMKAGQADGISFAIPIDTAQIVIKQLLNAGKVTRPKLGLKIINYTDEQGVQRERNRRDTVLGSGEGVKILVVDVERGGPAERAGLEKGDIIISKNGRPVNGVRDLLDTIGYSDLNHLELTIVRKGDHLNVSIPLKR